MNPSLFKKLLLNALAEVAQQQSWAGCNDIFLGERCSPLFKDISKEDLKEIENEWINKCPEEIKQYENKLSSNSQVTNTLIKLVEERL